MSKTNILKRFRNDKRGSAYVMAALAIVPMFGMMALAVDVSNHDRITTDLETAAQTVALHIAKRVALDPNRPADEFVTEGKAIFASLVDVPINYDRFSVDMDTGKVQIIATTDVDTHFMHMFGQDKLSASTKTQAQFGRQNIEVAIAIDNSGSMDWDADGNTNTGAASFVSRMDSAKSATEKLIKAATDSISTLSNANIKFSVTPWNMQVRVPESERGTENSKKWWIDWEGKSVDHFRYLAPYKSSGGGAGDMYYDMDKRKNSWDQSEVNDEWVNYDPNNLKNKLPLIPGGEGVDINALEAMTDIGLVTREDAFKRLNNVSWSGCFDHRAGDYKTSFSKPSTTVGNSLYLPHFAPDEYDVDTSYGGGWEWKYRNDYISDVHGASDFTGPSSNGLTSTDEHDGDHLSVSQKGSNFTNADIVRARTMNSAKYAGSGTVSVRDYTHPWYGQKVGPNVNCYVPEMIGLSEDVNGINNNNSAGTIKSAIDNMNPSGATDASIGISWAMNTLTPYEPFDEAKSFDDAQKILVIMTDGDNTALGDSDYRLSATPHGFFMDDPAEEGWGLDGPPSSEEANAVIDDVSKDMCSSAKAMGVKIYFVYFGSTPSANATSLRDHCASTPETAIYAASSAQLEAAFTKIGDEIGKLRLTHYTPDP